MYAEAWKSLVREEVHSVYGVHAPSAAEKDDLLASGTCIFDVTCTPAHGSACAHRTLASSRRMLLSVIKSPCLWLETLGSMVWPSVTSMGSKGTSVISL